MKLHRSAMCWVRFGSGLFVWLLGCFLPALGSAVHYNRIYLHKQYGPELFAAILNNQPKEAIGWIDKGADITYRSWDTKHTILVEAVSQGYPDVVGLLIEKGAILAEKGGYDTAMHSGIRALERCLDVFYYNYKFRTDKEVADFVDAHPADISVKAYMASVVIMGMLVENYRSVLYRFDFFATTLAESYRAYESFRGRGMKIFCPFLTKILVQPNYFCSLNEYTKSQLLEHFKFYDMFYQIDPSSPSFAESVLNVVNGYFFETIELWQNESGYTKEQYEAKLVDWATEYLMHKNSGAWYGMKKLDIDPNVEKVFEIIFYSRDEHFEECILV